MVKSCCVFRCTNNKAKNHELSFYLIPSEATEPERRVLWLKAINRGTQEGSGSASGSGSLWQPKSDYTYVCSAHFISEKKSNVKDHPDYVPSIFPHMPQPQSNSPRKRKLSRFNRALSRKKIATPMAKRNLREEYREPVAEQEVDEDQPAELPPRPASPQLEDRDLELEIPAPAALGGLQAPLAQSEREMLYREMDALRQERTRAIDQVNELEVLLLNSSLSVAGVQDNEKKCKMLTGIGWFVFVKLFEFLSSFLGSKATTKASLPPREQLFITLVKLRHGVSFELLATIRGIKKTTTVDYFWKWIDLLHAKIGFLIKFQDRARIFEIIPPVFKSKFPRLTCIIDCFEIFIDAPRNLKARAQCWSNYKNHCTVKVFISCSPLGHVNFISKVYGGRASDVKIVRESGFMSNKYHCPGDQILADRGFTLQDELAASCGATLLIPAFTKGKRQLSAAEVETSRQISSVRIHIERVIGLLKNRYTILKGPLPIQSVKRIKDEINNNELVSSDKIVRVCGALLNLSESIVYSE